MATMVTAYMFNKIRNMLGEGKDYSKIARELGLDRKTVRKYAKTNAPPNYARRKCSTRPDPMAEFTKAMDDLLKVAPELTSGDIFTRLRALGYEGSERTVERRLANKRALEPKERFFEQVYAPGDQAQFDFKESVELPFVDGVKISHLHVGTLPFSSKFHIKGFPNKTYEAFADGIHSFFDVIGGMTKEIRIDNLSPCVRKVCSGNKRLYTSAFQRMISYYGFEVSPCAPGKGNEKGDVERDIQTYAHRIKIAIKLEGRVFQDYTDLNEWLAKFCMDQCLQKSHALLAEEKTNFRSLPARRPEILGRIEETNASSYGLVRIAKSSYSVPDQMIGRPCIVELTAFEVIIRELGGAARVIIHQRQLDSKNSILLEHVLSSLVRKPRAMLRWAHRDLLFPTPIFRRFYDRLKKQDADRAERDFLKSLNLIQYVTLSDIGAGMELVLEGVATDLYEELKRLVVGGGVQPQREGLAPQPALNPRLSDYDSLIPSLKEVIGL